MFWSPYNWESVYVCFNITLEIDPHVYADVHFHIFIKKINEISKHISYFLDFYKYIRTWKDPSLNLVRKFIISKKMFNFKHNNPVSKKLIRTRTGT